MKDTKNMMMRYSGLDPYIYHRYILYRIQTYINTPL